MREVTASFGTQKKLNEYLEATNIAKAVDSKDKMSQVFFLFQKN